jgi:hydrocephalus-inducing protein
MECAGVSQPLFTIVGSCQGMEIKFDSEAIPFGSVTKGSCSQRKLMMTNSGDIGAAFNWKPEMFAPAFSISPTSGYISPGMEVPFDIVFKPTEVNQDIRYDDLKCTIENGKPLKLCLTGSCISPTAMKEVISFQTHVRMRDTKSIPVYNKTNQTWSLNPVIDGEFWSGADLFVVEPQQSKNYEISYRPFVMTPDSQKKHTGTVFFALPDGTGLLYNLIGSADPPKPIQNIQREVPGKTAFTEILTVNNWLRKPQRFRVFIDMIKPEKPDPATSIKGLEYVDVPGLSKKEYKVNFYAHKEGTFSSKVTFKNETSGEYQFFYITFKAASPTTIACIELSTPVRQSAAHVLTIKNPLNSMVNFQTNCNVQDVNMPPQFTIPPQSEGECTFEYMPLKSGNATGRLNLNAIELGTYIYDLNLTATPAASERPVHFRTNLGTSQVQACKFMNYSRARVEYMCKIDNPDFLVEKSINAASASSGGTEVSVDVTFEPSKLGDSKANLLLTSNIGGEYSFPLVGSCQPPKPQGPYTIKAGSSTSIPFKNIFGQTTAFSFHTDNPCFTVKEGETIRAKKIHNIQVSFEGNQGESKVVRMGRFVVTCNRNEGTSSNISWTFYLKGVTP